MVLQAHDAAIGYSGLVEAPLITSPAHPREAPITPFVPDEKHQNQKTAESNQAAF